MEVSTNASNPPAGWLSDESYSAIQQTMPIPCSDALLWRNGDRGIEYGLILRNGPHRSQVWCLIGGRIRYGEDPVQGLERHLVETVGAEAEFELAQPRNGMTFPDLVAQYAPDELDDAPFDHRQHSVANTYLVEYQGGAIRAGGEAIEFRWFEREVLQENAERLSGFGQHWILLELLARHDV